MQVILTNQAEEDFEDIAKYLITEAGQEVSVAVIDEIQRVIFEVILKNPRIGRKTPFNISGLRCFPAGKYSNYNIYYTVVNDIVVIRVLYGKRDIQNIIEENKE